LRVRIEGPWPRAMAYELFCYKAHEPLRVIRLWNRIRLGVFRILLQLIAAFLALKIDPAHKEPHSLGPGLATDVFVSELPNS